MLRRRVPPGGLKLKYLKFKLNYDTMNTMKKNMAMILIAPFILFACNQDKIKNLSKENEQLASEKTQLNQELEDYISTFNEIETNLAEIKKREDKINLKTKDNVEYKDDAKTAIVNDIKAINELILENKAKMQRLQSKLDDTNSEFKKMVARLNQRVNEKNQEIAGMKTELEKLNFEKAELAQNVESLEVSVDTLLTKTNIQKLVINAQEEELEQKTSKLNTAYVAIGSSKELEKKQVIDKTGGILGLGATETLNENLNEEAFSKVNIKETKVIPFDSKKVELITPHPSDSYQLAINEANQVSELLILDPDKFWHSSKFLVLKVN